MARINVPGDQANRISQATGKAFSQVGTVLDLQNLPMEYNQDLEKVYRKWGSITAAYFLGGVTGAPLTEIKMYLDSKGWHFSAD